MEINDNIVAFWRPKEMLKAGGVHSFVYRLHWCPQWPMSSDAPEVAQVKFSGGGLNFDRKRRLYVIEFGDGDLTGTLTADVSASTAKFRTSLSNTTTTPCRRVFLLNMT